MHERMRCLQRIRSAIEECGLPVKGAYQAAQGVMWAVLAVMWTAVATAGCTAQCPT